MAATEPLLLVLDQGGHASRALVFDRRGRCLASSHHAIHTHAVGEDRVEHDAAELVASFRAVLRDIEGALGSDGGRISAGALATQRSSIVCWDRRDGVPLSPVLSWQDRRAAAWLAQLDDHADWVHKTTGLVLSPHYGASKLRWCLEHLPEVAEAHNAGHLAAGPLASFLVHRLTRERRSIIDPANAARTLLWSFRTLDWEPDLLQLFNIPRRILPDCRFTRHDYGTLDLGAHAVPLGLVTGDQSAALYAQGEPDADSAYLNLGTGAFIQRIARDYPRYQDDLLTGVVYADAATTAYALEGTVNGAGRALDWFAQESGAGAAVSARLGDWLTQDLQPPLFLNGVAGLAAPFWIADFASAFVGDGGVAERAVAVAESIIFLLQINLDEMAGSFPPPRRLVVTGGLASLDGLCQRLADLSGVAVFRPAEREATARGAAYLLAGRPSDWDTGGGSLFQPHPATALRQRFHRWCAAMSEALR